MTAYIIENMVQYDLTDDDVATLTRMGFLVATDDPGRYETTGLVWDDLGLEDDRAYDLFDAILGRNTEAAR